MYLKKAVSLFVAAMMLLSFVACTSDTEVSEEDETKVTTTKAATTEEKTTKKTTTKAATTTKKAETTEGNPFAEKMTINWLVGIYSSHLYEEGRWDELELEEKFNVDLKMWNVMIDSKNMEQVQMMLAAGDVPDYGFYYTSGKELVEQDMARTVPLNMIQQFYPSYYEVLMNDPIGLYFNRVEGTDEYYGLTAFTCMSHNSGHENMWRLDWLENLGYEMENLVPMNNVENDEWDDNVFFSNTKFSMDEVKEIYRAFTEDDPDGNGEDDTFATCFSNSWYDCYTFYCNYGLVRRGGYFFEDPVTGDYVPYYAYTPYKDALAFVTEMLDKGYMRWRPGEDSVYTESLAVWSSGKNGFFNANSGSRLSLGREECPPASVLLNDPDATFVITQVAGENGKFRPYWVFDWSTYYTYPIGGNVSDAKLARLFQLLEYSYFGEDWLRYKWGIEGVHYKWADEPYNSPIVKTDPEKIPVKYRGSGTEAFGQFGNANFIKDNKVYFSYDAFSIQWIDYCEQYIDGGYYSDNLWIRPDKYYSEFTMPEDKYEAFKELREETSDQIGTVVDDFTSRVFDGKIANLDDEWELYIEQLYAAGLEDWVEIWNSEDVKTYEYYTTSLNIE